MYLTAVVREITTRPAWLWLVGCVFDHQKSRIIYNQPVLMAKCTMFVCLKSTAPIYLIFQYCCNGDLLNYLKCNRERFHKYLTDAFNRDRFRGLYHNFLQKRNSRFAKMSTRQWITAVAYSIKKKNLCGREWNEYIVLKGNRKSKGVHKWINCRSVTVNDCVHLSACCISTVSILSLITTNTCTWFPQPKDRRTRRSSVPASAQCLLLRVGGERENMNFF